MNYKLLVYLWLLSVAHAATAFQSKLKIEQTSATQMRLEIVCDLAPDEVLFHNSLQFSSNMPALTITKWFALKEPHTFFDPRSKKSDPVYSGSVVFTLIVESPQVIPAHAIIHMHYTTNLTKHPEEKLFPLNVTSETEATESAPTGLTLPQPPIKEIQKSSFAQKITQFTSYVTSWIQDKELPLVFKFLLAFIIGLIMSLTPCIYPMIPITMGILQANKAHSLLRGFSLASAYTAGLSMTFAILGMLAAKFGAQFGSLMSNPLVIIPIVLFFAYLGFSMLGFYDMYVPKFMQPKQGHKQNGSLLSAFTFGMINGTVASPCLSPGLALMLGIVSGMSNPVLGFLLLFVFGVGSSFPLLIIGTFSSSLHVLPRAGMWMIEFKKVFGFLLLGMCLYYLRAFIPAAFDWSFYIILGLYIIVVAAYYLYYGFNHRSWVAKLIGFILCVVAAFTLTESYRAIYRSTSNSAQFAWAHGYDASRQQALDQHKMLLLDFTANWCSLCKLLEKEFFNTEFIKTELPQRVIAAKIDCTDNGGVECTGAKKKYGVMGFPTIILINPEDESVVKQWSAELKDQDPQEFINEIDSFIKQ